MEEPGRLQSMGSQRVGHDWATLEYYYHKNKWNIDMCYNIDEPWKHYANREKSDTKSHILYMSICMKYPE